MLRMYLNDVCFSDRPQARPYLARAILQNTHRLDTCEASLSTVIAMLTPEDITAIVDMLRTKQITSNTRTHAALVLEFIQTDDHRLTEAQVEQLAPVCVFDHATTNAFLTLNRLRQDALARIVATHLGALDSNPERAAQISALIRSETHAQMHDALKQYLQAHLPVF